MAFVSSTEVVAQATTPAKPEVAKPAGKPAAVAKTDKKSKSEKKTAAKAKDAKAKAAKAKDAKAKPDKSTKTPEKPATASTPIPTARPAAVASAPARDDGSEKPNGGT